MDKETTLRSAKQFLGQSQATSAVELLAREMQKSDLGVEGMYLLGVAYFRTGAFTESEHTFRQLISRVPDNHLAVYYLGLSLERQGQIDDALRAYKTAVKLEPAFEDGQRKLASFRNDQGEDFERRRTAEPPKNTARPMSDFTIPGSEEELDLYISRKDAKARAEFDLEWRAAPLPAKIFQLTLVAIVGSILIATFIFILIQVLNEI